ncbi:hypothetical protein IHE55_13020 [Streptomyces pactum]|uniref:DUF4232 domain-containing protein n=1 Tax=Streptomyces pactum TaxID=68249 RepID=A0ABS0NKE6_9ACTN|nr:hypothetical protein [Streptomyces pactum]MBH5335667.1 hypothetical protein [Streptomyces pactum]
MGSLRNPIGPLPSSIYWRRRAVALLLLVGLVLLIFWAFNLGGSDDGGKDSGKGAGESSGARTITPGPSSSTPVNGNRPGGRDEADDGGTGSSGQDGAEDTGGQGDGGGDTAGGSAGTGGGAGTGAAGRGVGVGDGAAVPADSTLPDCKAGAVELTVRSVLDGKVKNSYAPDEKPKFEMVVKNSSDSACKVDFGRASASLTITDSENDHVWATGDCSKGVAAAFVEVPGDGQTKRTVEWDRKRSAANCATPSGEAAAKPGTYLVEAKVRGLGAAQVSFVLEKD